MDLTPVSYVGLLALHFLSLGRDFHSYFFFSITILMVLKLSI